MIQSSLDTTVQGCTFNVDVIGADLDPENVFPAYQAIGLGRYVIGLMIRENIFQAFTLDLARLTITGGGIVHLPPFPLGDAKPPIELLLLAGAQIRDNLFLCGGTGINISALGSTILQECVFLDEVEISGNDFLVCIGAGIRLGGLQVPGQLVSTRVDIASNNLSVMGSGVQTNLGFVRIADNEITPFLGGLTGTASGVYLYPPVVETQIAGLEVIGNRIRGVGGVGINIAAPLASGTIVDNLIAGARQGGILMNQSASAGELTIAKNTLGELVPVAADVASLGVAAGIYLFNVDYAEIEGNIIRNLGTDPSGNLPRVGIFVFSSKSVVVTDNQLITIGPDAPVNKSAGIAVFHLLGRADISGNVVRRGESPATAQDRNSPWWAVYIGLQEFLAGTVFRTVAGSDKQTFFVTDTNITSIEAASGQTASVRGNLLEAFGGTPAVQVEIEGQCIFSENEGYLYSSGANPTAQLFVTPSPGTRVIASNNSLVAPGDFSLVINVSANSGTKAPNAVVMGNITNAAIRVNNASLTAPWDALNIVAV